MRLEMQMRARRTAGGTDLADLLPLCHMRARCNAMHEHALVQVSAEELLFRGWLQPSLVARCGPVPGGLVAPLMDLDLSGLPLWGGQEEGLNASIGTTLVLLALSLPLLRQPSRVAATA